MTYVLNDEPTISELTRALASVKSWARFSGAAFGSGIANWVRTGGLAIGIYLCSACFDYLLGVQPELPDDHMPSAAESHLEIITPAQVSPSGLIAGILRLPQRYSGGKSCTRSGITACVDSPGPADHVEGVLELAPQYPRRVVIGTVMDGQVVHVTQRCPLARCRRHKFRSH